MTREWGDEAERRCTGSAERCVYTNGPGNRRAAVLKGLPDQVRRGSHEVFSRLRPQCLHLVSRFVRREQE